MLINWIIIIYLAGLESVTHGLNCQCWYILIIYLFDPMTSGLQWQCWFTNCWNRSLGPVKLVLLWWLLDSNLWPVGYHTGRPSSEITRSNILVGNTNSHLFGGERGGGEGASQISSFATSDLTQFHDAPWETSTVGSSWQVKCVMSGLHSFKPRSTWSNTLIANTK